MIHLKEKSETIPFDISGIRAFDYDLSDLDSVEEIKNRLIKTISTINFDVPFDKDYEVDGKMQETKSDGTQLLSILYDIQDEINSLKTEIHNKDTETIQAIVKASIPTAPVEDPNMAIMKAMLPELIKNPNSMKSLIELSEVANKNKK